MKTKLTFLTIVSTIVLAQLISGQDDVKKDKSAVLVDEPTFEKKSGNYHMRVWVTALDANNGMSASADGSKDAGSHFIMVEVLDSSDLKGLQNISPKILAISPSGKSIFLNLKTLRNKFGGKLKLEEKGEYEITVSILVAGTPKKSKFKYNV